MVMECKKALIILLTPINSVISKFFLVSRIFQFLDRVQFFVYFHKQVTTAPVPYQYIMPPKAKANVAQAKAKAKAVEEKTFGMKNKKGAKAQKQVQSLKSSMVNKVNNYNDYY